MTHCLYCNQQLWSIRLPRSCRHFDATSFDIFQLRILVAFLWSWSESYFRKPTGGDFEATNRLQNALHIGINAAIWCREGAGDKFPVQKY